MNPASANGALIAALLVFTYAAHESHPFKPEQKKLRLFWTGTLSLIIASALYFFLWTPPEPPLPESEMHILQIVNLTLNNKDDVYEISFSLANTSTKGFSAEKCSAVCAFIYRDVGGNETPARQSSLPPSLSSPSEINAGVSAGMVLDIDKKKYDFSAIASDIMSGKCDVQIIVAYKIENYGWYSLVYDAVVDQNNTGRTIYRYVRYAKIPPSQIAPGN